MIHTRVHLFVALGSEGDGGRINHLMHPCLFITFVLVQALRLLHSPLDAQAEVCVRSKRKMREILPRYTAAG